MARATKTQPTPATTRQNPNTKSADELTFIEHIYELRSRLFFVFLILLAASSVAFLFNKELVEFILAPLHGEKLVFLTIGGGFSFIFTVCIYFGLVVSIPAIVFHLYKFIRPVMNQPSRRLITGVVFTSIFLAVGGAAFGYFVAIQASIDFLLGFASGAITSSVTAESYLNFIIMYTAGLAAVFQLPLILFIIDHIRPFPPGRLLSSQRFVITGAVIVAALITPTPDIVNQMIIAVPVIVIYQIGAIAIWIRRRRDRKVAKYAVRQAAAQKRLAPALETAGVAVKATAQKPPVVSEQILSSIFFDDKDDEVVNPFLQQFSAVDFAVAGPMGGVHQAGQYQRRSVSMNGIAKQTPTPIVRSPQTKVIVPPRVTLRTSAVEKQRTAHYSTQSSRHRNRSVSIDGFSMV